MRIVALSDTHTQHCNVDVPLLYLGIIDFILLFPDNMASFKGDKNGEFK